MIICNRSIHELSMTIIPFILVAVRERSLNIIHHSCHASPLDGVIAQTLVLPHRQ